MKTRALMLCAAGLVGTQPFTGNDDRMVLAAVFEQSVRPWVTLDRQIAGLPAAPIALIRESVAACESGPACASVEALRTPDSDGRTLGSYEYRDETRQALVMAFAARNRTAAPLPLDGFPDVVVFPDRASCGPPLDPDRPGGCVELSRPAYISSGFALVYGQAPSASGGAQGWAFILTHAPGHWEVQHAYLLWIRP